MFDTAQDLSGLKDIHLPKDMSIFPLAFGSWLIVFFVAVLILSPFVFKFFYKLYALSIRRNGFKEVLQLENKYNQNKNLQDLAISLSRLIKRIALLNYDREYIAKLHGSSWVDFLVNTGFDSSKDIAKIISDAPYLDNKSFNADLYKIKEKEVFEATKKWIRQNT